MTEKTFAGIDLITDTPPGICPDCSQLGIEHLPSGIVFVHCQHTNTGAFRRPGDDWIRRKEINAEDFRQALLVGVLKFEKAGDVIAADVTLQ